MAEQINIRVTQDMPSISEIEQTAAKFGFNKNRFFVESVKLMCLLGADGYGAIMNYFARKESLANAELLKTLETVLKGG
jgi:hypothetical protein